MRLFSFILLIVLPLAGWAGAVPNPCSANAPMSALVDRPSKGDSVCTIPTASVMLENGYQYQHLTGGGHQQNFLESELRLGLPENTEFAIILPNYNVQSEEPGSGFAPTTFALKHVFGYTQDWIWTAEVLVSPNSGGDAFGSDKTAIAANGIVSYNFTDSVGATFQFGVSSQPEPPSSGSQRYTSVNPDLVLAWQLTPRFDIYGEIYGQNKTGPDQSSGADFDGGIQFLAKEHLLLDVEWGQRVYGNLGGFNNYIGCGISIFMV